LRNGFTILIEMLSAIAADHVQRPRNCGPLEGATSFGTCGSRGDGPYVEIWLEVQGDLITRAAYRTPGCPSSTAAASMLAQLVTGRTLAQAGALTDTDLLRILGGLPEGKEEFATMAVKALSAAITDHIERTPVNTSSVHFAKDQSRMVGGY
jgi:NifU-like protein involved in Fe-S cluster formation